MSAKKRLCVYLRQYAKTFPWATTSRKGSSFAFGMKCSCDINLGRGGDLRRHHETKLHKHSEKDGVGVLPLQSYFGPIWEESVIRAHISLESTILPFNWEIFVPNYSSWCFLILQLLKTLSAVILKQKLCWNLFPRIVGKLFQQQLERLNTSASKLMRQLMFTVTQQAAIMLWFFGNTQGQVRYVFFALEIVERATAELLFNAIDKHVQDSTTLIYDNLVGLGKDGANVMLGARNSVILRLRCKPPTLVALHCHCHIAALIAKEACKVLPDELEDLTTDVWCYFQMIPRRLRQFEEFHRVLWNASHTSS